MWFAGLIVCLYGQFYLNDAVTLNWSKSYSLKAILKIPSAGLTIPYQVWVNGQSKRSRLDFEEGLIKLYRQWNDPDQTYEYFEVYPDTSGNTDKEVCDKIAPEIAETVTRLFNVYFTNRPWKYAGSEMINNIETQKYTYSNVYTYTVWVSFKNESKNSQGIPVPLRFVSERKEGNITGEYYLHDYLYFDDKRPDVQTLLMPLCMKCNTISEVTLHDPIDIVSKYVLTPSGSYELKKYDINRYETNRSNCAIAKDGHGNSNNEPETKLNLQLKREKSPERQRFITSSATESTLKWSNSYTLKAVLTVPAANIIEPYQVWLDGESGKSRVDFYHGMDKLYREYDTTANTYNYFKVHPIANAHLKSKEVCNEVHAKASEVKSYALNSYLPVKRWTYVGNEHLNNAETKKFIYSYSVKINQKEVGKVLFTVWVDSREGTAVPVRFLYQIKGETKVLDSFQHDYTYFDSSKPDASMVEKPADMNCKPLPVESIHEPIDPLMEYIQPDLGHDRVEKAFDWFKTKHSKVYTNEEHFKRMSIFKDNLRLINSFNRQHRSFTLGVNHLADRSKEELKALFSTFKTTDDFEIEGSGDDVDDIDDDNDEQNDINYLTGVHTNFDWRSYGAVSPVKDQTSICQSCYAFTTAAAIESSAYVARGCKNLDEISEQAIIDCSWGYKGLGNKGCAGGTYEFSLVWASKHGLPLKSEYGPYLALEGRCHSTEMTKLVMIGGYAKLQKEKRVIKDALRENGPLLASLDGNLFTFTFYASGVYDDAECSNKPENRSHGVVIIGYGVASGDGYWIIKNSFGQEWGEKGYMRIAQARNRCGLKNDVYKINFGKNESSNCKPLK